MVELAADGPGAPPRDNGEIVFAAPWQSRVFGVTVAVVDAGAITWRDFQHGLIAQVEVADRNGADTGDPGTYWACWLDTLAELSAGAGLVPTATLTERCVDLAERPAGHDH